MRGTPLESLAAALRMCRRALAGSLRVPSSGARLALLLIALGAPLQQASAQQFTVQGQVVDAVSRTGLAGISVVITGRPAVLTDANGRFRITGVGVGRHLVTASGLGYATNEVAILVTRDTALQLELELAPVRIDSLEVRAREVTVRGVVREKSTRTWLIDAEVTATPGRRAITDGIGRFRFTKVPSGIPMDLRVRVFGYVPAEVSLVPERDTTLAIELAEDSVVQRMIAAQVEHLNERSQGRRFKPLPVLDRRELMKNLDAPISEIMKQHLLMTRGGRVACVVIDDNPLRRREYDTLLPDRIERVEVLEYPGMQRAAQRQLMVRIYTREFMQQMVNGQADLVSRDVVVSHRASGGMCR